MDKIGSMYTLEHQRRLIGNSGVRWLERVGRWQEKEREAKASDAAELEGRDKSNNPLIKLLLTEPTIATKPTSKPPKAVRKEGKRKKVVKSESEEEKEEEEEGGQLYVAELDTFVLITLIELALRDPAGNEEPREEQDETRGEDECTDLSIVSAGRGEQVVPADVEETEQQEE